MRSGVAEITVTRPDGTIVPPEPTELAWQPHLRFYRYARTTDDLADAYRNTFLALESILSEQVPVRRSEGERTWFVRALTEVAERGFSLEPYAPGGTTDVVSALVHKLYQRARHPLFHAKVGRDITLPSPAEESAAELLDALQYLSDLYLALVRHVNGVGRPTGHIFPIVFQRAGDKLIGLPVVYTADDSELSDFTTASSKGLPVFELGQSARKVDDDRYAMLFEASGELERPATIQRLCLTDEQSHPLMGIRLEMPLVLLEPATIRVTFGNYFVNESQVRRRFST